ncbi:hypothetical protein EDEG_01805 [Edhazardia aedis USNM 41457]|uniref:FCP1 homology domain-containing protein n=1 Tax=Edhazardia aedis (strain USNM 41457) TaxID=1003232 RepID=J9DMU9_EDHAE|nr:hypothetical protein EDEG_01805 [Edhazardia aedis USNM 41457]|eukprot:EJW03895.1 hypothetical protein EDEG_01805 [Edhazardia aedis USNM 41457]
MGFDKIKNNIRDEFRKNYYNQGFPYISACGLLGCGTYKYFSKRDANFKKKATDYLKKITDKIFDSITIPKQGLPVIPEKTDTKPVFVINSLDHFVYKKFDPFRFAFLVRKRAFTDVFLFHMAHLYEIVLVSKLRPDEGEELLKFVDPYGCINYRLFSKDSDRFGKNNLNRNLKKLIVLGKEKESNNLCSTYIINKASINNFFITQILRSCSNLKKYIYSPMQNTEKISTIVTKNKIKDKKRPICEKNVFQSDFSENLLCIKKWKGNQEGLLMDLLDFCMKIEQTNIKDYRPLIKSYSGKDFTSAYKPVQTKFYLQKFVSSLNFNRNPYKQIENLYKDRITDFKKAKMYMDQQIARDRLEGDGINMFNLCFNFITSLLI